ncbi:hypothetical protein EIN_369820 [Entamoeba invadens IP1]|uniref:Calcineurin-like phosphoesterase domain-containing protein n=1 Tax=Entamoeba invadens IP1 TaxID=370355 RepID=A0A0A1UBS2_ENTIV|nr:hypothetical protein EIN_369820 [Entamoeba invadens IP1]ELP92660.1 hypothetical protein EIN_369820 [Entamoeba invadens IP1]|eukprot:XP_004259431.1 hypothetical protein EIN_369820 [Entamoeba invadens IP1]
MSFNKLMERNKVRVCVISDTHLRHKKVIIPECDLLICCGDFSSGGKKETVESFAKWLEETPSKERVVVFGNHENKYVAQFPEARSWFTDHCTHAHLLLNERVTLFGIEIFGGCYAIDRTLSEKQLVEMIQGVDLVVTHEPPYSVVATDVEHLGSKILKKGIAETKCVKCHVFGHSHGDYGYQKINNILYVNAALCIKKSTLKFKPMLLEYVEGETQVVNTFEAQTINRTNLEIEC